MKVEQIYNIVNTMANEVLGSPNYMGSDGVAYPDTTPRTDSSGNAITYGSANYSVAQDLSNIVDVGKLLFDQSNDVEKLFSKLINHIGRVIFVNRAYQAIVPSVYKDGWEYGSIMEKIDADMPDSEANPKWYLQSGSEYKQDTYKAPSGVRVKLFNDAITYQISMSYTSDQLKQSFSNAEQLNAFMSMIETKIKNKMTINYANLVRSTINNFISATVYADYNSSLNTTTHKYNFGTDIKVKAVNLLAKFKSEVDELSELTAVTCLKDLEFLKYATYQLMLYSDRMRDMSILFNIGGKERFTPKDKQHIVLLSEFEKAASTYLQSDTFHNELVRLPEAESINFWQGVGDKYEFTSTGNTHTVSKVTANGSSATPTITSIETICEGIIGVIFDNDALGITNERNQTTSHYNGNGDFINYWYKSFARYFNDYDENFVVFFVA